MTEVKKKKKKGLAPTGINLNFLQDQPCLLIFFMRLVKILAEVGGQQCLFFSQILDEGEGSKFGHNQVSTSIILILFL